MSDKSSIGDRMKRYELVTKTFLPRRTHCIIRLDGKAFHSYTKYFEKPFDWIIHETMCYAAGAVVDELQGATFGYTQSDEVSILITDFSTIHTEAPYDYNVQKLASISASVMTAAFNHYMHLVNKKQLDYYAYFDSRVFSIPERTEVYNYFLWRQRDCTRNSIQALGHQYFGQKEMHGLTNNQVQDKLFVEKGINWSHIPNVFKNGTLIFDMQNAEPLEQSISQDPKEFMKLIPERLD